MLAERIAAVEKEDIVFRLRQIVRDRRLRGHDAPIYINGTITDWIEEAANEIENLREQIPAPAPQ